MIWLVVAIVAVLSGWLCTRLARDLAIRFGLVDRPDGRRKIQVKPIPLAGGIGVLCSCIVTLVIMSLVSQDIRDDLVQRKEFVISLAVAAIIIGAIGVLDDKNNLRARYKLMGQILASFVMMFPGGLVIHSISFMSWSINLGLLEYPLTLFWFLASINALNLLDGLDGLLGTVGVIVFTTLAAMCTVTSHMATCWIAIAMVGSLLGFLRYNLPPASVYLGDCGSMLIGLGVASIAISSSLKGPTVAIVAPIALLILPVIDTSAAIIRRRLTGRGIAVPDRGHFHHVLLRAGFSNRRILMLVSFLGIIAGGGALFSTFMKNDLFSIAAAIAIVMILVLAGLFGNAEYRLMREQAITLFRKARSDGSHVETEVRLHGTGEWNIVWKDVTAAAEQLNLRTICLDVNAPAWHEDYHVRWDRIGKSDAPYLQWRAEIPLFGHGQSIGRLTVIGPRDESSISEKLSVLAQIVEAAEAHMASMTSDRMVRSSLEPKPAVA
jgi:UDP-GlcNAc:undecaprenyl-phosphate/decaprenyl-phosphate GlcNAc-1-phosphate transferase